MQPSVDAGWSVCTGRSLFCCTSDTQRLGSQSEFMHALFHLVDQIQPTIFHPLYKVCNCGRCLRGTNKSTLMSIHADTGYQVALS